MSHSVMPLAFLFLLSSLSIAANAASKPVLTTDFYAKTCPDFHMIIRDTVTNKQLAQPTTAAGTLRLFFHDCFLEGCDASVLVATNAFNESERSGGENDSLPGDAFDLVTRAKTALELRCPGVVSCADIVAQATRDLVVIVGGPFYNVQLGRKDGLVSRADKVATTIPVASMTLDHIIRIFESNGFSLRELVAMTGAHTIGFSHCKQFADRLFTYGDKKSGTDPDLNPKFANALKDLCKNYTIDNTIAAFNDVMTPGKFDNMYFKNLQRGLGLLATDQILIKDPRTKDFVNLYANNETIFFEDFARAMEKLGSIGVKGEGEGEIRRRCDQFNSIQT